MWNLKKRNRTKQNAKLIDTENPSVAARGWCGWNGEGSQRAQTSSLHMVGDATGLHRSDDFTEYTMFYYAVHLKSTECMSIILKILNVYNGYNYYIKWINTKSKNFALVSNLKKNLISNF